MRFLIATVTLLGFMALGAGARGAGAGQMMKSQWDGVYSLDQAKRGEPLYADHCAACHGGDLTGGEMAPALAGADFSSNWNGLTLGDIFERIRISMPQNNPSALSRAQKTDILAYMLYKGNFPAGQTALPTETEAMKAVNFVASKPGAN